MRRCTLEEVVRYSGGRLLKGDPALSVDRLHTDTRTLAAGDCFVALQGDRFDGHDYVLHAVEHGAVGALVSREVVGAPAQVIVGEASGAEATLVALQNYAASWRSDFELPVVAVTGSSGKTTTKQMLAAIFAARGRVLANEGNLNNHIGVPLTLLRLNVEHDTAVIEMGANHAGEIALLASLARPDVGIVTQAGDAHLEGFGSRDGVARAKGELFAALNGGVAVINADDPYAELWQALAARASILRFGFAEGADVRAENLALDAESSRFRLLTPAGQAEVLLALPGRHNIANALAAAAAGTALGLSAQQIAEGLGQMKPVAGRLSWKDLPGGARLLDDTYNANPTSARAAMDLLAALPGQRWLVLGDMKELGPEADRMHEEVGRAARALGIDRLYTLGPASRHAAEGFGRVRHFDSIEALVEALREDLAPGVSVLVKGSRSSRMERVVAALTGTTLVDTH